MNLFLFIMLTDATRSCHIFLVNIRVKQTSQFSNSHFYFILLLTDKYYVYNLLPNVLKIVSFFNMVMI